MKIVCWNVNGIRSAFEKGLAEVLLTLKPDLVTLQEVKAQEQDIAPLISAFADFDFYFSCAEKKGYSGVATLVHKRLKLTPTSISRSLSAPHMKQIAHEFENEGRMLLLRFKNFSIYNIYFPSGTTGESRQEVKYRFLEYVSDHFSIEAKKTIVCGDFNICHRAIDIHHPKEAEKRQLTGFLPEERAWLDRFIGLGFVDSFRLIKGDLPQQYSWWSFRANSRAKNLGWRIDYCFVSKDLVPSVRDASIYPDLKGSDHCPISIEVEI